MEVNVKNKLYIMKSNKINVTGDYNQVLQDIKNSSVDMSKKSLPSTESNWTIVSAIVAIIGLTIAIIVGWDAILKFFGYAG